MYEDQTFEVIMARLLSNVPSDVDKSEGSLVYDALAPAALELAQAYVQLDTIIALGFAQTTSGIYLDYRSGEHGITRKTATKATGQVTITGAQGTVVPINALFATAVGLQFSTLAEVTIGAGGAIMANVEAVIAGTSGNVPAGTINTIPISINGVTAVTNNNPTSGGTDEETDAALLARLLNKVREPATSGNIAHYHQWALEVAGIGDARIQSIWNGNGTVRVIVIDSNKQPASAEIVQGVSDYIEALRPIGATVTVISATGLSINIAADVTLDAEYTLEGVKPVVESGITAYLKGIAFQQDYVSYAKIGSIILDTPGVLDYANLTINTGTGNVPVSDTEVAVLGTVTLT